MNSVVWGSRFLSHDVGSRLDRRLTIRSVVGCIFASPGIVLRETGSVGSDLVIWVFAGALNWAGASSFAELGTSIPLNGGAQACQLSIFSLLDVADSMYRPANSVWRATVLYVLCHGDRLP